ncbi:MAG: hypothetical protein H0T69_04805 [Thermoleophilaceae bacterium]|nr:hypothetical protein [Thermoleophilaceae bacterium]
MRRLLTSAAAVLLLGFAAAPAAHALPARDIAGVALHPWQLQNHDTRERVFAGVAATGARWVRVDMPWSWVEPHGPTLLNGPWELGRDRSDRAGGGPARAQPDPDPGLHAAVGQRLGRALDLSARAPI